MSAFGRARDVRRRLPATQPRSVEQALSLLGIEYRDNYKGESKHSIRPPQLMALCPFHSDRKESFSIRGDDGVWYCFACCTGGSLAWLTARIRNVPIFMAEEWVEGIDSMWVPLPDGVESGPEFTTYSDDWFFAHYPLPPSWALEERGISEQAAAELSIGWDKLAADRPSFYGLKWPPVARSPGGWILPVRHPETFDIIGWQTKLAAAVEDGTRTEAGTPKSLTLFGLDIFKPGTTAILVEDALDAARLLSVGLDGALASFGAGVSRTQLQLLTDRASRVVLALDNDEAGRKGIKKAVGSDELAGTELYVFSYEHAPDVKDPGEMSDNEIREGLRTAKRILR